MYSLYRSCHIHWVAARNSHVRNIKSLTCRVWRPDNIYDTFLCAFQPEETYGAQVCSPPLHICIYGFRIMTQRDKHSVDVKYRLRFRPQNIFIDLFQQSPPASHTGSGVGSLFILALPSCRLNVTGLT